MKKRKDMEKKAKSMKLVTVLLTWCDSIRGKTVKSEGGRKMREERCEVICVRCLKPNP